MIFIDSNIPMYLIGGPHPHKSDARLLLEMAISGRHRLVSDAEVFQEVLHRFAAIKRTEAIDEAFALLSAVVDEVYSIEFDDVVAAKEVLGRHEGLSARDAIHLAVMRRHGVDQIMSFDGGFDRFEDITRNAGLNS